MKNNLLCKVLSKLIVWEGCGFRVVPSIDSIAGIELPDYLNCSSADVVFNFFAVWMLWYQ